MSTLETLSGKKDLSLPMKFIVFTIISAGPWLNFYLWLLPKCHRQWIYRVGDSGDFGTSRYQGIVKATVSYMLQHLKFKISEGLDQNWSCPETANRAESGQLQFWSEPSEILNLRSSNTPETVVFNIPWYLEVWKNVTHPIVCISDHICT